MTDAVASTPVGFEGAGQDATAEAPVRRVPPWGDAASCAERMARLRRLAHVMDSNFEIPGLGIRFGLDPIVGIVPVLGDIITSAVSLYIVREGKLMGVSRGTLLKMLTNVAIDFAVGEIPALGDVFDLAFKANDRNIRLIEADLVKRGISV